MMWLGLARYLLLVGFVLFLLFLARLLRSERNV